MADENPSGIGSFDLPLRMRGQRYDSEINLYYNYFRDYDPNLARYIQSDPIGPRAGLNTYAFLANDPTQNNDPLGLLSLSVGAGGAGNFGPVGLGADSGVEIDPLRGTICFYTAHCYMYGWNTPIGGALGLVGSITPFGSLLCCGTENTQGDYFYGGEGLGGEGQVQYGDSGLTYGRGIFGVTSGAGAGYIHCEITHYCLNEPKECKGGSCKNQ